MTMKRTMLLAAVMLGATLGLARADAVQDLWDTNCAGCHGKDGQGTTKMGQLLHAPNYTDPKVQASFTDEQAVKKIKEGVTQDGKTKMKAFGDQLSDQQIKDLVKHIRAFKKAN